MLRASQDQDIFQINNNMKTLATAKKEYGFSEWKVKTLGFMVKPFTDKLCVAEQKVKRDGDA